MSHDEPITTWLESLKAEDGVAAQKLWDRYCQSLSRLARARFGDIPRTVYDEEDAALSAFRSFCSGVARGMFQDLNDRHNLWRLLVLITARKVAARRRYENRQKRRAGTTGEERAFGGYGGDTRLDDLSQVLGKEPSPEFAMVFAEECDQLFDSLGTDRLRDIARMRMEGHANSEIAIRLGCTVRSVQRKLELIRAKWEEQCAADDR